MNPATVYASDFGEDTVETIVDAACEVADADDDGQSVYLALALEVGNEVTVGHVLDVLARRRALYREELQSGTASYPREDVGALNEAIATVVDVAGGVPDSMESEDVDRAVELAGGR